MVAGKASHFYLAQGQLRFLREEADTWLGADSVGKDADQNGGNDGEAGDLFPGKMLFLLKVNEAKHDRGKSTWSEPAHEGGCRFWNAGSGDWEGHRKHGHDCYAEDGVDK